MLLTCLKRSNYNCLYRKFHLKWSWILLQFNLCSTTSIAFAQAEVKIFFSIRNKIPPYRCERGIYHSSSRAKSPEVIKSEHPRLSLLMSSRARTKLAFVLLR